MNLMKDKLSVVKVNGTEVTGLVGSVQGDKVLLMQATPVIEAGDEIVHHMSNGTVERYVVEDPGFNEGLGRIPKHYQMTVRKRRPVEPVASSGPALNVVIHGHNARVNHHSTDNSVNIVNDTSGSAELVAELRQLIDRTELNAEDKKSAQEVADEIDDQFRSGKPKGRIVSALIGALPTALKVADIGVKLIALAHGTLPPG